MKTAKGRAVAIVIVVVAVAVVAIGVSSLRSVGLWFIQGTCDRLNPFVTQVTVYARAPAPDAHFDSYADATGSGENYVYEVHAYDENGAEHTANLISFGSKLDSEPSGHGDYLKLRVKGSYVQSFERLDGEEGIESIPDAAKRMLGALA